MTAYYSESWLAYHVGQLQRLGVSPQECQRLTGLPPHWMTEPKHHRKVPLAIGNRVLQALYECGHHAQHELDTLVGHFEQMDFHKAYLMNSDSLDTLLQRLGSILQQDLSANRYQMRIADGRLTLQHECPDQRHPFLTPQGHFAFLYKLFASMFHTDGTPLAAEVHIVQSRLPAEEQFSQLITPQIRYRAEHASIVFPLQQLRLSNPYHNPQVDAYLQSEFRKRYNTPPSTGSPLLDQLRRELASRLQQGDTELSIEAIARRLQISRTTLYRHLAEQNVTFTQLLEAERKSRAMRFLKETSLSMGEISDRLGYANLSAFNRAFKRWFDTNPTRFRH